MKHKKTIASIAFSLLGILGLHAQESPTATGGEATGTGGTVSYSVGQIVYTSSAGTNGSISQGVQQHFETPETLGINEEAINSQMVVYPNPVINYLQLKIENTDNLTYQLVDVQGKIIETKKVNANYTTIKMDNLPKATYFLKVTSSKQTVKTFIIIKN